MKHGETSLQYHLDVYNHKIFVGGDSGSHLPNVLLEAGWSSTQEQVSCGFVAKTGKTLLTKVSFGLR